MAILSLALGIGANTAIFSILDSLMLRSLPVKAPTASRSSAPATRDATRGPIPSGNRSAIASDARSTARSPSLQPVQPVADRADRYVDGFWASGRFFDVLGVPAILGRTFTEADDRRGGGPDGPVAVISYRYWQSRYGGAADVDRPGADDRARALHDRRRHAAGILRRRSRPDVRRRDPASAPSRSCAARRARSIGDRPGG